jgi:hypothetical protein
MFGERQEVANVQAINDFINELSIQETEFDYISGYEIHDNAIEINITCDDADFAEINKLAIGFLKSDKLNELMTSNDLDCFNFELITNDGNTGYSFAKNNR